MTVPEDAEHTARRLVEAAVYAPIGLAVVAAEQVPTWVESRRQRLEQRVILSRIVGKLVVDQGLRDLRRRLDARSSVAAVPSSPNPAPSTSAAPTPSTPSTPSTTTAPTRAVAVDAVDPDTAPPAPATPTTTTGRPLPIEGYDSLAAPQVLDRLDGLDADELAAVAAHERSHRHRRTILGRIAQLAPDA